MSHLQTFPEKSPALSMSRQTPRRATTLPAFSIAIVLLVASPITISANVIPFTTTTDMYILNSAQGSEGILKITSAGVVSVFKTEAQILAASSSGVTDLSFAGHGIAFDSNGVIYFTAGGAEEVFKVATDGSISVLASTAAVSAVTGEAAFDPSGLTVGSNGNLFVVDREGSDRVLEINSTTGAISVFTSGAAITAVAGITASNLQGGGIVAGPSGAIFVANQSSDSAAHESDDALIQIDASGTPSILANTADFTDPDAYITRASNGDILVADDVVAGSHKVLRVTSGGTVSTFLSSAQLDAASTAPNADLNGGIAFDSDGNFYLSDLAGDNILKFSSGTLDSSVFVSKSDIQTALGISGDPSLQGMAFAPEVSGGGSPIPEPMSLVLLGLTCAVGVALSVRRARMAA